MPIIEKGAQLRTLSRFAKSYQKGRRNFEGCNDNSFRSREDQGDMGDGTKTTTLTNLFTFDN